MTSKEEIMELLANSKGLQLMRVSRLGEKYLIFEIEALGAEIVFSASISEIIRFRRQQLDGNELKAGFKMTKSGKVKSRGNYRSGKAPYHDADWLKAKLKEYGSYRALAAAIGISENTISAWARKHGLEERRTNYSRELKQQILQAVKKGGSYQQIAERFGVSKATVCRVAKLGRENNVAKKV